MKIEFDMNSTSCLAYWFYTSISITIAKAKHH